MLHHRKTMSNNSGRPQVQNSKMKTQNYRNTHICTKWVFSFFSNQTRTWIAWRLAKGLLNRYRKQNSWNYFHSRLYFGPRMSPWGYRPPISPRPRSWFRWYQQFLELDNGLVHFQCQTTSLLKAGIVSVQHVTPKNPARDIGIMYNQYLLKKIDTLAKYQQNCHLPFHE